MGKYNINIGLAINPAFKLLHKVDFFKNYRNFSRKKISRHFVASVPVRIAFRILITRELDREQNFNEFFSLAPICAR